MNFADTLASRLEINSQKDRWAKDPVSWVQERLGEHPWSRQAEIMHSVAENPLTAVQSGHGVGKSWVASRLIAWALDTSEPGSTFCVTTAPRWDQVKGVLWRYVGALHRKHGLSGYVNQNCEWKIGDELVGFGRKPADHDESGFQGFHAERVLVIIDEAGGVPAQLWNAVDSLVTTDASRVLAIGNPDTVSSHFFQVCRTEPGWNRIRISAFDSPNFTGEEVPERLQIDLVRPSWVDDKARRWGTNSALYKIKVEGEFAESDDGALIPMVWVQQAMDRWRERQEHPELGQPEGRTVLGVDVGHMGEDRTVIAVRKGDSVLKIESWSKKDTVEVSDLVEERAIDWVSPSIVVDGIGVGAGVVDQLRVRGLNVVPFIASASTKMRDTTGTQGFVNVRSAAWWHLRTLLDPSMDARLALPPDDDLLADLTTPRYEPVAGGKLKVESKDEIRKRLKRSTDYGDAVVQAMWVENYERGYSDDRRQALKPLDYADANSWQDW